MEASVPKMTSGYFIGWMVTAYTNLLLRTNKLVSFG